MPRKFDTSLLPEAPDFNFEISLWEQGFSLVAGVDEAGRGAIAGPVAAAALIFRPDPSLIAHLRGVNDSKVLKPVERTMWAARLRELALDWGVGFADSGEIDQIGILAAVHLAAKRALDKLKYQPQYLITDYLQIPDCPQPQLPLVKGDARSMSVAAASIIAKTARDSLLCDYETQFPGYGFARHKGYGTAVHFAALANLGPLPIHRHSFKPVREYVLLAP